MSDRNPALRARRRAALAVLLLALLPAGCVGSGPLPCEADADCAKLDDGDLCNGVLSCVGGACRFKAGSAVSCDAAGDTACMANRCAPETGLCGMPPRADGSPCDDGAPCTAGDRCVGGACKAGDSDLCDCATDADCKDDGDLCNGVPTCVADSFPRRCVVLPSSVVTCAEDDKPCTAAACDPKTGACAQIPSDEGASCDDGDACTAGEVCSAGSCSKGQDICSCTKDADCIDADGDACTGVPSCVAGTCKPGPAVVCGTDGNTACLARGCVPETGACDLLPVAAGSACDDGDACTGDDTCVGGTCLGTTNACACTKDADCSASPCEGTAYCDKATATCEVNPATALVCDTSGDTACAKTVCVPKTGVCTQLPRAAVVATACKPVAIGPGITGTQCTWLPAEATQTGPFPCDDGDACTSSDGCAGATCTGKTTCACAKDADCTDPDADKCTGVPFCDKGTCKPNPASVVTCDKKGDSACEKAACQPATGACALAPVAKGAACSDGSQCTTGDTCDGQGACVGDGGPACDDGDPCTTDACVGGVSCAHTAPNCDDGNACTVDSCKKGACVHDMAQYGLACDADGNGCTVGDACNFGVCVAGKPLPCAGSAGPCEVFACVPKSATQGSCQKVSKPAGTPCADDATSCTAGATCQAGVCAQGAKPRLWTRTLLTKDAHADLQGVAAFDDQTVIAVGRVRVDKATDSKGYRWLLVRLARHGGTLWSKTITGNEPTKHDGAAAVLGGGDALVAGVRTGKHMRGVVEWIDKQGKVTKQHKVDTSASVRGIGGLARVPSGGFLLGFRYRHSSDTRDRSAVRRYDAGGKLMWYAKGYSGNRAIRGVALSGGAVGIAEEYWYKSSFWRWGYRVIDLKTGTSIEGALPGQQYSNVAAGIASTQHGLGVLAAGKNGVYFRRLNQQGLSITASSTSSKAYVPRTVAARPSSDGYLVAGKHGSTAYLAAWDAWINRHWRRDLPGATELHGVGTIGDDILAVGYRSKDGTHRPVVMRVGPYGHTSCATACAGLTFATCDDGKPCTTDSCDAKTGCSHTAPQALTCDPKDGCSKVGKCAAGACAGVGSGSLFNIRRFWSGEDDTQPDAIAARKDGTLDVWSWHPGDKPFHYSWGPTGGDAQRDTLSACSGLSERHGALVTSKDNFQVFGAQGTGSKRRAARCVIPTKSGSSKLLPVGTGCSSCASWATGGAESIVGLFAVGVTVEGGSGTQGAVHVTSESKSSSIATVATGPGRVNGVVALPAGSFGGLGACGAKGKEVPCVTGVDFFGKKSFVTKLNTGARGELNVGVLRTPTELVVAGAAYAPSGAPTRLVAAIHAVTGAVQWTRVSAPVDLAIARHALVRSDGDVVLAGDQTLYGQQRVFLERLDAKGGRVWRRTYLVAGKYPARATSLAAWSGGYALGVRALTTSKPSGSDDKPGMIKTDSHGHEGCGKAGGCLKTPVCDDKDPCTSDWCHAINGCQFAAIAGCKKP